MQTNQMIISQERRHRIINEANYIISTKATVRQAAEEFGVCKSTIHRDMSFVLPQLSECLTTNVAAVFKYNDSIKHLRGGETTRERYSKKLQQRRHTARLKDQI